VVDADADGAATLASLLRTWGHEVVTARDGPAALREAAAFRPQVAFLDLGLPGQDGCELARRLRRLPGLQHTILVAVTGHGQEAALARCGGAGFALHLFKPVELDYLDRLLGAVAAHSAP
jgi:two-component system CheB/CheR fusion protein